MTTARPLRIALVTSGLAITGGLERCVLEDTEELVAAGHDVVVWHRDDEMARAAREANESAATFASIEKARSADLAALTISRNTSVRTLQDQGAAPVELAKQYLGLNENRDRGTLQGLLGIDPVVAAWY